MFAVAKYAGSIAQGPWATAPVDSSQYRLSNERATAPRASYSVDLGDDHIVEFNVHSHVYSYGSIECADAVPLQFAIVREGLEAYRGGVLQPRLPHFDAMGSRISDLERATIPTQCPAFRLGNQGIHVLTQASVDG